MSGRDELLARFEAEGVPGEVTNMRGDAMRIEPALAAADVRSVLEVGCGDCLMIEALWGLGYEVAGYEPASMGQAGKPFPVWPYFDGELPALAAGSWDAVLLLGTLERMPDATAAEACLREAFRIARLAVVLGTHGPAMTAWEKIAVMLGTAGQIIQRRDRRVALVLKAPAP